MYIKYKLTPGQMAPTGSTGIPLDDEWMVWEGETFNPEARWGRLTPQDPTPADTYIYEEMTQEEIDRYNELITEIE